MSEIAVALTIVFACLFVYFYWRRRRIMRVFTSMAVPGPNPSFLIGNLASFANQPMFKIFLEWRKHYGNTFGYFEGPTAVLMSSDVSLLRQVFLTKFSCFEGRKKYPVQVDPRDSQDVHMFFAEGERWRRLRAITTAAFTPAKLKQLSPLLNERIDDMERVIDSHIENDESFNIHSMLQRLTLDAILNCGFGMESQAVKNPDDIYLSKCRGILTDTTRWAWIYLLAFTFPAMKHLWFSIYTWLGAVNGNPVMWIERQIRAIVAFRKRNTQTRSDLLQMMLDSECKTVTEAVQQWSTDRRASLPVVPVPQNLTIIKHSSDDSTDSGLDSDSGIEDSDPRANIRYNAPTKQLKMLTSRELAAQCFVFMLAGYETTSTSLAFVAHELSQHPDVQRRLQAEIDSRFGEDEQPAYDSVQSLKYLDMVWRESLRMYPSASNVIARECMTSCTINGIRIPKGMVVQANVWAVHYDTELWGEDADQFNPDRFSPEACASRDSFSWMPFGAGYRNCIGARFAVMEAKIALVRMLSKYSFVACGDQPRNLELLEGATITPRGGVTLRMSRRDDR